jgi:hypothetical protein
MKATAPPPEKSLRRLIRYAEFYRDLAATGIRTRRGCRWEGMGARKRRTRHPSIGLRDSPGSAGVG